MNKKIYTGVIAPEILFPNKNIDLEKWCVVACDQFTSQPEYWEDVKSIAANAPSTLNIILPEVYLESEDSEEKINVINDTMKKYLEDETLISLGKCMILTERTCLGKTRNGLVLAIDLEEYDYNQPSTAAIRATEGTVLERIPPRQRIRRNACLETPHVMLLVDDPDCTVIEPLLDKKLDTLYDIELMKDGGHITGKIIKDSAIIDAIQDALLKLKEKNDFLFAVGDGNHSLASAKAHYEEVKKNCSDYENHPARYALVELVNLYDKGLEFEPIHRAVFNSDIEQALHDIEHIAKDKGFKTETYIVDNSLDAKTFVKLLDNVELKENEQAVLFVSNKMSGVLKFVNSPCTMPVGTMQMCLDELTNADDKIKIDYIHGEDVTIELGTKDNCWGILLPPMSKFDLFTAVNKEGALPRKTFSMGEAVEKRYYIECRKIKEN